jgi:hypothetical protein
MSTRTKSFDIPTFRAPKPCNTTRPFRDRSAEPLSFSRGTVNISSRIFVNMADAPNDAPVAAPFQAVQVEALVS